jgi:hypothetical protein
MGKVTVQETTDYGKFSFLDANRDYNRGHVEKLKTAFQEVGNLTQVQPILVNEKNQIIDGQHRFIACSELGLPLFYTVAEGLRVEEARSMNILHRRWISEDYLKSYIASGNKEYIKFAKLMEDYGFSHSTTLYYSQGSLGTRGGGPNSGIFKQFREGNFVLEDEAMVRSLLQKLAEVREVTPFVQQRPFATALYRVFLNENYDHKRMLKKLRTTGQRHLRSYSTAEDNLRMLESIYNNGYSERNQVRLY